MAKRRVSSSTEYMVDSNPWRVEEFRSLKKEFAITELLMPHFHLWAATQPHLSTAWRAVRMLYGIDPLVPNQGGDADYFNQLFSMDEIAVQLKCEPQDIDAEMDLLKQTWARYAKTIPKELPKPAPLPDQPEPPPRLPSFTPNRSAPLDTKPLSTEEEEHVRSRGFAMGIFDGECGRSEEERNAERRWFYERLVELKKVLDEPMAKSLGRQAIINELHMRRCDDKLLQIPVNSTKFWDLHQTKLNIEKIYHDQWAQVEEICPYVKGAVNKMTFAGVVSDLIRGVQQYKANQDNSIIDGLFTNFELQVELRQSQQAGPRYRPGLVAAINEAKSGLWDPQFRRTITDRQCRIFDLSFQKANEVVHEKEGVVLPDLLQDGANSEYPPLSNPMTSAIEVEVESGPRTDITEEPIVPPEESVAMEDQPEPIHAIPDEI